LWRATANEENERVLGQGAIRPEFAHEKRSGICDSEKIPFTGDMKVINPKRKVKFVALGSLRALEEVTQSQRKTKAGNSHRYKSDFLIPNQEQDKI
jgi:hypothetical protein